VQLTDADLRTGEVTIVNFWASWCPPCRAEHPNLLTLQDQGYRVAGINFRDQQPQASGYLVEHDDPSLLRGSICAAGLRLIGGSQRRPKHSSWMATGRSCSGSSARWWGRDYEQRFLPELAKAMGG